MFLSVTSVEGRMQNLAPGKYSYNLFICYTCWRDTSVQGTQNLALGKYSYNLFICERLEPRSYFKRLSLIIRVNVVLNRTVVVDSDWRFDNLCGSHLQSQSESCHVCWWYYTLVIDLIGQLCRNVIGRLSVKPWCYFAMKTHNQWLVRLDPSIVTVKQSSIVSQIVSSPVVLSYLGLLDLVNKSFVRRW